jgi:fructose-1,6-bisphosphatase/inositol monophosphatase family enzyme
MRSRTPDFSGRDLEQLAAILRAGAREEIMPRFRRLPAGGVREKSGPLDLVTDADEAAERFITAALEKAFPGVLVVGEEAAAGDHGLIGRLAAAPMAITLDPIDGTANYAAGVPLFGVMAAVVEHGVTTACVMLDPVIDSYAAARLGDGAAEHAADGSVAPLRVAPAVPLARMTGMVSWRFLPPAQREHALANLHRLATVWDHRCAAHEYRILVSGHGHFVLFYRLMPWDHLPGVLLHTEAGGYAAKFDGSAYVAGETTGGLICAGDEANWVLLRDALVKKEAVLF